MLTQDDIFCSEQCQKYQAGSWKSKLNPVIKYLPKFVFIYKTKY